MIAAQAAADPLTDRIAQSNAAGQSLQGPLDGNWALRDPHGHTLFTLTILDPPTSPAAIDGAWRDDAGHLGTMTATRATPSTLRIVAAGPTPWSARLLKTERGAWRGTLSGAGPVTLTRSLATGGPGV